MGSRASTRPRAHPGAYVSLIMSDTSNWLWPITMGCSSLRQWI
jgi:hypothetical protein